MKKNVLLLITAIMLIASSCHKIDDIQPVIEPTDVKENTYPAAFDWSTTREVAIEITGLTALPDIRQVLTIQSPGGNVYLKQLILINQDFVAAITIPSTESEVMMQCGNIHSTIPVTEGKVNFSLNTGSADE